MREVAPNDPAVVLSTVSKRFGEVPAVDRVSLRIERGEVFGLLGPNGAGKTTTIKLLLGLLLPDAGGIRVLGLDPRSQDTEIKQRVGYVPEAHYVHRWMRVSEAVAFCRALFTTWNDRRCGELLDRFELDPKKKVRHLSKGTATKLALVLAMAHEPELLILDEPTSGLDPLIREELLESVLGMVCDAGPTVIFSSHMLGDIQRLADRVGILCDGRLLVEAALDELLSTTKRVRAVLRDDQTCHAPPEGTVYHRRSGREWLLTIRGFGSATLDALRAEHNVDGVEVLDVALEDLFKDFVKGQRMPRCELAGSVKMKALLWKEYRNHRSSFWGGFAMIAAVYLLAIAYRATMPWWDPGGPLFPWGHVLMIAALISLGGGVLIHIWLAAESVAKERADRSAEFLAYLPASRGRMIAAKGLLLMSHAAVMWLVNLVVLAAVFLSGAGPSREWPAGMGIIAATALQGLAAAWLASCVLSNPTVCMGIGQLVPLAWGAFCAILPWWTDSSLDPALLYIWGGAASSPVLFSAGVRRYMNRREL